MGDDGKECVQTYNGMNTLSLIATPLKNKKRSYRIRAKSEYFLLFLAFSLLSHFLLSFSFLFDFVAYLDKMWSFGETRSQRHLTSSGLNRR